MASWAPKPILDTLSNITFEIEPGQLIAIVGNVGSGKSSLLQLILRELIPNSGTVETQGSISYSAQEPWLFVSSIRNNVLFGECYDKQKYAQIINVCALEKDLRQLKYGDKTFVGERGSSLSGGQRARVHLARAVYRNSDIYLFDDPLAAVDSYVSKYIFDRCIVEYLKEKTRIIVTHQVQHLRKADLILLVNNVSSFN